MFFPDSKMPSLQRPDPVHRLHGILMASESSQTEVPLPAGAEAGAGRANHIGLLQQAVEKFPACHSIRSFHPDIRGVDAAGHRVPGLPETVENVFRIFPVIRDLLFQLPFPLLGVDRLARPLYNIGRAVVFGSVPSGPEGMKR